MSKTEADKKHADPHQRLNLSMFVDSRQYFKTNDEQTAAQKVYNEMVEKERELKRIIGDQLHIQQRPKEFDYKEFCSATTDNALTKALKEHFKAKALNAAWDYMTLKQSAKQLKEKQPSNTKPSGKEEGHGVPVGQSQHGATGGQPQKMATGAQPQKMATGGQTQQEIPNEEAMEVDDQLYEEQMEEDRKSVIVSLLWMNHDYFDQKLLNKAYTEYRFYKLLEKEMKGKEGKGLGDLKSDAFKKGQFESLPKDRPIWAVISTILENAKETEHAKAAAQEYIKFIALEKKMKKEVPQEIQFPTNDPTMRDIRKMYRTPKMTFRQAAEFKMVPLEEYRQLRNTIEHQRNQISELSTRLTGIANQQVADGEIFTDIGNNNTPRRLGQRFADIFEDAWSNAYEVLKPKKPESQEDEKEETDEKTVDTLQKIVKVIYDFCKKMADQQVTFLMQGMTPPIITPTSGNQGKAEKLPIDEKEVHIKTQKMAKDYRKAVAPATIPALQTAAIDEIVKAKLLDGSPGKEIKEYIDNCVHLIWFMCIQQPPMYMVWAKPGEKFNKEIFRFSGKKGQKFRLTVWPAVLYHEDGPMAAAGYAIPE